MKKRWGRWERISLKLAIKLFTKYMISLIGTLERFAERERDYEVIVGFFNAPSYKKNIILMINISDHIGIISCGGWGFVVS